MAPRWAGGWSPTTASCQEATSPCCSCGASENKARLLPAKMRPFCRLLFQHLPVVEEVGGGLQKPRVTVLQSELRAPPSHTGEGRGLRDSRQFHLVLQSKQRPRPARSLGAPRETWDLLRWCQESRSKAARSPRSSAGWLLQVEPLVSGQVSASKLLLAPHLHCRCEVTSSLSCQTARSAGRAPFPGTDQRRAWL